MENIALQSWQIRILLYYVRELQHFATKLCSFSNFDNFFLEISFVIPRLKMFLKRKSSIKISEVKGTNCSDDCATEDS